MSDATMLVFLSVVMLIGSFLAGSVPLIMSLSEVCVAHFGWMSFILIHYFLSLVFPLGSAQFGLHAGCRAAGWSCPGCHHSRRHSDALFTAATRYILFPSISSHLFIILFTLQRSRRGTTMQNLEAPQHKLQPVRPVLTATRQRKKVFTWLLAFPWFLALFLCSWLTRLDLPDVAAEVTFHLLQTSKWSKIVKNLDCQLKILQILRAVVEAGTAGRSLPP